MKKVLCAYSLILLLSLHPARAADFAAAFLETGVGVRGPGMGSAFSAVVDDASAPYWNPAGLVESKGKRVLASLQPLSLDRLQNSASFALNVRGELAFGFTYLHAGVDGIEGRSVSGAVTGSIEDSENAFYFAVGRALGSRLALGFTMKILQQRVAVPFWEAATASGHGFDLGLRFRLGEKTALAAAARNLGARLSWKVERGSQQTSNTEDELPRTLVVGLSHRLLHSLLVAADFYQADDFYGNLGAEWSVNPLLTVRGGLNRVPGDDGAFTAGLSLRPMRRESLQLHYAYATDPLGAGGRTLLGLSLIF